MAETPVIYTVDFWLPHNETVQLVDLKVDATIEPLNDPGSRRWIHHGSSISHGSNATAPSAIWPAITARSVGNIQLTNLGFGGSAMVDPFMARIILDTIRDGHPNTPLLLISPLHCAIHEQTPGPGAFDPKALASGQVRFIATGDTKDVPAGRLTLESIRAALKTVVVHRTNDSNLHFIDGLEIFGEADEQLHPLEDSLHPGPEAHEIIGQRFAQHLARSLDGKRQ